MYYEEECEHSVAEIGTDRAENASMNGLAWPGDWCLGSSPSFGKSSSWHESVDILFFSVLRS